MLWFVVAWRVATAQPAGDDAPPEPEPGATAAGPVELSPDAADAAIQERLGEVLAATGGFDDLQVSVSRGVVFLRGSAREPEYQQLAGELAKNTEGVVAVVDRLELASGTLWDLGPAREELRSIRIELVRALPSLGFGLAIGVVGWFASVLAVRLSRPVVRRRLDQPLLQSVASRTIGVLVFLVWLYLALRVVGLTRLAGTVVGGTGILGLVVGIAFRGITENFLASLLLSFHRPFREGDLVEIGSWTGYVESLTARATVLTSLDGVRVQIPNATVFTSVVQNHSSTVERRESVVVSIGYDNVIPQAQALALEVLRTHPAVLADPAPWVLVDALAVANVELKLYFWFDGGAFSRLKVRSSVLRLVKRAFQEAGVSMTTHAGKVVVRRPLPLRTRIAPDEPRPPPRSFEPAEGAPPPEPAPSSTESENGLSTEATVLEAQAKKAWRPGGERNLLPPSR